MTFDWKKLQLSYFEKVGKTCPGIGSETKFFGLWVPEKSVYSSLALLYNYSKLYKITKDKKFLILAEYQLKNIENYLQVNNPNFDIEKISKKIERLDLNFQLDRLNNIEKDHVKSLSLGTLLLATSEFYSIKKYNLKYLENIANNINNSKILYKDLNTVSGKLYIQAKIRQARGLVYFYRLSKDKKFVNTSKDILLKLNKMQNKMTFYIYFSYLRSCAELLNSFNDKKILNIISLSKKNINERLEEINSNTKPILLYQPCIALDELSGLSGFNYKKVIKNMLIFLIQHIDKKNGGILESKNYKTISLNAELTTLLFKYLA